MRILHIIPNLVKGGAQRIAIDISRELSTRANVEVLLVYFDGINQFEYLTKDLAVKKVAVSYQFSMFGSKSFNISALQEVCDEFKPDIIHSHLFLAEFISCNLDLPNARFFTHCHDNIRQFNKFGISVLQSKSALGEFIERKYLFGKYAEFDHHFIAIAEDGLKFLKDNLPVKFHKNIHLLHNAIDLREFEQIAPINENPSDPIRLINVGNFIPKKQQTFLVQALKLLQDKKIEVKLSLVGDGEELAHCKHLAKELNVDHSIQFLGRRDDVSDLLVQHDLYVHSALYEPFGLVLVEAMASGLPILSLDGKGNRDLIKEGKNGFLIEQGNINKFVEKIIYLSENRLELKKMGTFALDFSKGFGVEKYVDDLLKIYKTK